VPMYAILYSVSYYYMYVLLLLLIHHSIAEVDGRSKWLLRFRVHSVMYFWPAGSSGIVLHLNSTRGTLVESM
jgi:hypothetical protein